MRPSLQALVFSTALVCSGFAVAADDSVARFDRFSGALLLNWPDTNENTTVLKFLENHDDKVVFLSINIDVSESVEDQTRTMSACRLDPGTVKDGGGLLNRNLGFPTEEFGTLACWRWLYIESSRTILPRNGASTGIVFYNLDGFFFVRSTVHGDNPRSFHLRELDADAATWAALE